MTLAELKALRSELCGARVRLDRRRYASARRSLDRAIETLLRAVELAQARAAARRGER